MSRTPGFFISMVAIAVHFAQTFAIVVYRFIDWVLDAWPASEPRQVRNESYPAETDIRGPMLSRDRSFHARRLERLNLRGLFLGNPAPSRA